MGQTLLQPNREQYSLEMLLLYPRYTRASYLATTGQQAPPFVVTEPIKRWALPPSEMAGKNALELFTYRYVDASTGWLSAHSIPYDVAGRLNLPGVVDYPKYGVVATGATAVTSTSQGDLRGAINPDYLSNFGDAQRLAAELSAGAPFIPIMAFGSISYPPEEMRRAWSITLQTGVVANAGILLKDKYKAGVGAPGHWSDLSNPQWIAEPQTTVEANLLPETPFPCRDLYPDEAIVQVFMGGWVVQRKQIATKLSDIDLMPQRVRDIWNAVLVKP